MEEKCFQNCSFRLLSTTKSFYVKARSSRERWLTSLLPPSLFCFTPACCFPCSGICECNNLVVWYLFFFDFFACLTLTLCKEWCSSNLTFYFANRVIHEAERAVGHMWTVSDMAPIVKSKLDVTTCNICDKHFTFFTRKHHCRNWCVIFLSLCFSFQLSI